MTATEFVIIVGMALVTFGIRGLILLFSHRITISGHWERALVYVPPAVLTAITVPAVLMPGGTFNISLGNHYLLSGAAALFAGLLLRRWALWAAIVAGLSVFVIYRLILL